MTKVEKLKGLVQKALSRLSTHEAKLFTAKLTDGTSVNCTGDLVKGATLNGIDDGGNASPLADGEYKFDDGGSVIIKDAVVESFTAPTIAPSKDAAPKEQAQSADENSNDENDDKDPKEEAEKDPKETEVKEEEQATTPITIDDVNAAIAAAIAPLLAKIQACETSSIAATKASEDFSKVAKAATELSKQTQISLREIGEVVEILADEPSTKKVEASNVNPFRDSESYLERTAHLKK